MGESCDNSQLQTSTDDIYKKIGRDSEAGRLIYNIYNSGKRFEYKPNVKFKTKKSNPHAEHLAKIKSKHEQVKSSRASVQIPPSRKKPRKPPPIFSMNGRKPQRRIVREMRDNFPRHPQPPLNRPTKSRKEQIKHIQAVFSGESEDTNASNSTMRRPIKPLPESKSESLQKMFDSITSEIEERHNFLETMKKLGQDRKYEAQIKCEIAGRVRELHQVERMIDELNSHK
eukprot:945086_1